MDQSRENTRSAPASRAVAANTSGGGISHPAVTPFQFNKEEGQFASSQQPVQLYTKKVLEDQSEAVKAATGSGPAILAANKTAQEALAGDSDKANKKLTPYFTSMGVEAEFAQQNIPAKGKGKPVVNALTKAHVIVAKQAGYALYPHLDFLLETDAGAALEFVTPALLAPIRKVDAIPEVDDEEENAGILEENAQIEEDNQKAEDNVIPDPGWEKSVRKGIEFSLRDISSASEKTLKTIIEEINAAFSLTLPIPATPLDAIKYGNIDKSGPGSHTNVQLNYITTLQHFMDINRGTGDVKTGDSGTEEIYLLAMTNAPAEYDDGGKKIAVQDNPYVYALCQKLREIPSMLVDETFSVLLHNDENPDADITVGRGKNKNKDLVKSAADTPSDRDQLANAASHIKDGATLWLKASFDQILAGIPRDKYETVYEIMTALRSKKAKISTILNKSQQVDALKKFHTTEIINKFITDQLDKLGALKEPHDYHLLKSDIKKKPAEQKTLSAERRNIIGGRPDTYAPTDKDIHDESLFLVETRKTTSYLGLTKEDAYKKE